MHTALIPGTFDPITKGHKDIIARAAKLFDRLIVAVADNPVKNTMFTLEDRVKMVRDACADLNNVQVRGFDCMLPDFLRETGSSVLIRGVRTAADCDYELQLTGMYRMAVPDTEIVMLPTAGNLAFISSTLVRDVIRHNGDISLFVHESTAAYIAALKKEIPEK